jgi:tRNA(Ile2) C34 agmatinyltransferase TiaS
MICPKCDKLMESMGYGDEVCPECGHVEYSESAEDFYNRVDGIKPENGVEE